MVDRNYITSNPCAQIKKLREEAKKREPLTAPMLRELRAHLERGNRNYLLACMLEYYCFILLSAKTEKRKNPLPEAL